MADNSASGQAVQAAGQAMQNASGFSVRASASVVHAIAASGQVTFAVSAIPLAVGGAVSGQLARDSINAANAPIGTPLPITDEIITITPPDVALKTSNPEPKDNK
ncbi:MAG TPA: hypothetical protein VFK88_05020 [Gallionella sp.]|nr:hypothetical protein [Gallionella sp.]